MILMSQHTTGATVSFITQAMQALRPKGLTAQSVTSTLLPWETGMMSPVCVIGVMS